LKKVASAAEARKNEAKKRSLHRVNEHFELNFDDASASAVVFQRAGNWEIGHVITTMPLVPPGTLASRLGSAGRPYYMRQMQQGNLCKKEKHHQIEMSQMWRNSEPGKIHSG
jgi:hypothetical protein